MQRDTYSWDAFLAEAAEPHCSVVLVPLEARIVVRVTSQSGLTEHAFDEATTLRDAVRNALTEHLGPVFVRFQDA